MSLPRPVIPGSFYLLNRRTTQRQFLMRPDAETNNAYLFCLMVAALRCSIDIILMCAMSNHHHVAVFDRFGRYPEFLEHFHKLFARSQNALRGRWENFWSSHQTSVVRLETVEDVIEKLVYIATNPVKDHLVARAHQWPGINGYRALVIGKVLHATKPRHFFREDGPLPQVVEAPLCIPPELGNPDVIRQIVEERVTAFEQKCETERARSGMRVLGRRGVLSQSWKSVPASVEPRRNLNPRVAAKNVWVRIEGLARNKAFVRAYRAARVAWSRGETGAFPPGTYWLRRFANVPLSTE